VSIEEMSKLEKINLKEQCAQACSGGGEGEGVRLGGGSWA
jgi:hypothetical protein